MAKFRPSAGTVAILVHLLAAGLCSLPFYFVESLSCYKTGMAVACLKYSDFFPMETHCCRKNFHKRMSCDLYLKLAGFKKASEVIWLLAGRFLSATIFVLDWLAQSEETVINLDALTYAGNRANLASLEGDSRHIFVKGSITDFDLVARLTYEHHPRGRHQLCG